jgi:hypothetical protein
MLDVAEWLAKNREDLGAMVAAMRRVSAPKSPPRPDPAVAREQAAKKS